MVNRTLTIPIPQGSSIIIREWLTSDIEQLPAIANNRHIWLNLKDIFPYPYTHKHATLWVRMCTRQEPKCWFAIADGDTLLGSIGIEPKKDIYSINGEIGYWLGEPYWGKGIATAAVEGFTDYVFDQFPNLHRVYGSVFEYNYASQKVLQKAGFQWECTLKKSIVKDGAVHDELIYAKWRKHNHTTY